MYEISNLYKHNELFFVILLDNNCLTIISQFMSFIKCRIKKFKFNLLQITIHLLMNMIPKLYIYILDIYTHVVTY